MNKKVLAGVAVFIVSISAPLLLVGQASADPVVDPTTFQSAPPPQGRSQYIVTDLGPDCNTPNNPQNPFHVRMTTADGKTIVFTDRDPCSDTNRNLKHYGDGTFICNQENNPTRYGIQITSGPTAFQDGFSYQATIEVLYSNDTDVPCSDSSTNAHLDPVSITLYYSVTNPPAPTPPPTPPPPPGGGGGTAGDETCESNSALGLEWIVCPILRGIDKVVASLYSQVEDWLCFPTGPTSDTAGGTVCDAGANYLSEEVHDTWSIIKNVVTALLVVIMLIAVLSQALNWGPLDAYTIRRSLPKLVAAVILIQVSWYLAKFAIDLSNDLGRGIASLLYYPFAQRGINVSDIDVALGNIGATGVVVSVALFAALAALVVFSGITVFGILVLAVPVLLAILVGFLTLLFRQILIIMCVILISVAIAAWILPGTERYWKLWRETFTKLLLMFPLIVTLIAAGRIFAYVGGNAAGGFAALILVLVGFFGPLFLLPKTFSWGGAAMSMVGNALYNNTRGFRRRPADWALGAAKENRQYRAQERARRISRDPSSASRMDRLLAGGYNPMRGEKLWRMGGGALRQKYARTVAEGQKAARDAVAEELLVAGYQNWSHEQKLDANEKWLRGETDPLSGISAEGNEELRLHAFKTLADLGDQDRIRRARQDGKLKGSTWLKGRAENISSLNQQASDMGIQADLSTVAPEAMASWKSHTFKEWMRQLDSGVMMDNSDDGGGDLDIEDPGGTGTRDPALRGAQLSRGATQAQRLLNNRLVFDRLSADQQEFVRRIATQEGTRVVSSDAGMEVPAGDTLAASQPARESVISGLSDTARGRPGVGVATTLAPRIIEAARVRASGGTLTPQQAGDLQIFEAVRDRSRQPGSTPETQTAATNLEQRIHEALAAHEAQTEQTLTAAGSPNVDTALNTEKLRSQQVKTTLGI